MPCLCARHFFYLWAQDDDDSVIIVVNIIIFLSIRWVLKHEIDQLRRFFFLSLKICIICTRHGTDRVTQVTSKSKVQTLNYSPPNAS